MKRIIIFLLIIIIPLLINCNKKNKETVIETQEQNIFFEKLSQSINESKKYKINKEPANNFIKILRKDSSLIKSLTNNNVNWNFKPSILKMDNNFCYILLEPNENEVRYNYYKRSKVFYKKDDTWQFAGNIDCKIDSFVDLNSDGYYDVIGSGSALNQGFFIEITSVYYFDKTTAKFIESKIKAESESGEGVGSGQEIDENEEKLKIISNHTNKPSYPIIQINGIKELVIYAEENNTRNVLSCETNRKEYQWDPETDNFKLLN